MRVVKSSRGKKRTIKETFKPESFTVKQARRILFHVRVYPELNKGWRVTEVAKGPQTRVFNTKQAALEYAKRISEGIHQSITVHDRLGRIQEKISIRETISGK